MQEKNLPELMARLQNAESSYKTLTEDEYKIGEERKAALVLLNQIQKELELFFIEMKKAAPPGSAWKGA